MPFPCHAPGLDILHSMTSIPEREIAEQRIQERVQSGLTKSVDAWIEAASSCLQGIMPRPDDLILRPWEEHEVGVEEAAGEQEKMTRRMEQLASDVDESFVSRMAEIEQRSRSVG